MLGAGTSASPWQVADYDDLKKVGRGYDAGDDATYALDDHYILTADIDASPSETENGTGDPVVYAGWNPIGVDFDNRFQGSFDGDGHTISDLYSNRTIGTGLFGISRDGDGTVKNLKIVDADIRSTDRAGILGAQMGNGQTGSISNVFVSGSVQGDQGTGGLIGDSYRPVSNCRADVDVTAISGVNRRVAGMFGILRNDTDDCGVTGTLTYTSASTNADVGGFSGIPVSTNTATNCYAAVDIINASNASGFSRDVGAAIDCFWDSTVGPATSGLATGKTTTEMQDIDTYTDTATVGLTTAWDMTTEALHDGDPATATWFIDDGVDYPRLWFEYVADDGDALTADNLTTGAPTLGEPTIEQEHALDAQALTTGAVTLDESTLAQTHALTADALATQAPTLGEPTVSEAHVLTADGVTTGTPTLDESTIAQTHALTADALATGSPTLGTPVLVDIADEVDNLEAEALTTGAVVLGQSTVAQLHILTADGMLTGAVSLGQPTLHDQALVEPRRRIYRRTA